MHIGVIPARAGSKRFPGKNRAKLQGIELWRYAVSKSLSTCDRTIVNTDDPLIQPENAERYERPLNLRDGMSYRIDDVLLEMSDTLKFDDSDIIHLFQPTNPFTRLDTIESAKAKFEEYPYTDSVQSMYEVSNIYHAYSQRVIQDGYLQFAYPEERKECYNSQRKPKHYIFAGYVGCRVGSLRKFKNIWGNVSIGVEAEEIELVDIDTREDLENAVRFAEIKI